MSEPVSPSRNDIENRDDLEVLVPDFYGRILKDSLLGPVFTDIAKVDWETHLPKITDFWETALFRSGGYVGNPLRPHLQLAALTEMDREKFDHWLALFFETIDDHFAGERSEHLKRIAADMAEVMQRRIAEVAGEG